MQREDVERLIWRVHESKAGREVRTDTIAALRTLLDRDEKAEAERDLLDTQRAAQDCIIKRLEAEIESLTKAHDTVCGILALAAKALAGKSEDEDEQDAALARLSAPETMAWAVVGEDGRVNADTVCLRKDETEMICDPEARAVRVAIRRVEEGEFTKS